ncbi:Hypothetical protein A7982_00995 [Minicystis rosea]|nr:Hypothetical protein A7982_00995 [Minicystis rosea]
MLDAGASPAAAGLEATAPPAPLGAGAAPKADEPDAISPRARYEHTAQHQCSELEGDPRSWQAIEPRYDIAWHFAIHRFDCEWRVERDATGIHAKAFIPNWKPIALPFVPSKHPGRQVVHCGVGAVEHTDAPLSVLAYRRVESGHLVGYNEGEWGGGLLSYDASGQLRQTITDENVVALLETPFGLLGFTGLAHGLGSRGHVLRLTRSGHWWHSHELRLPGAPRNIHLEPDGSVLVVTSRDLVRVVQGSRIEHLHRGHWEALRTSSVVRDDDGTIYIGMNLAVVRLRPAQGGYIEDWVGPFDAKQPAPT